METGDRGVRRRACRVRETGWGGRSTHAVLAADSPALARHSTRPPHRDGRRTRLSVVTRQQARQRRAIILPHYNVAFSMHFFKAYYYYFFINIIILLVNFF